ncbi:MAG: dienelactone hydrolase family protein [Verrucomicrobiia bacterium]
MVPRCFFTRFGPSASTAGRLLVLGWAVGVLGIEMQGAIPGAPELRMEGDLSAQMVAGIDRFLTRATERAVDQRAKLWKRDFTSRAAYEQSVRDNRERLRRAIGAVDSRLPVSALEYVSSTSYPAKIAETASFNVYAVRWPVFDQVFGEGLLLEPKGAIVARVIAIPDADQTPEMLAGLAPGLKPEAQFARRLAENGCQVLAPVLINRDDTFSGNADLGRFTNQPHREWIYRQAFELGRHIIGYEVQKVLAAVDWFAEINRTKGEQVARRIGVAGYGEGGLIAFYSAALDTRIDAALVSGYYGPRQALWQEPIYRNVFGLLTEFGDAEIASLIAPRQLVVEHSDWPVIKGPPAPRQGRSGAAPGKLETPERVDIEMEVHRAGDLVPESFGFKPELIYANEGQTILPGSPNALIALLEGLGVKERLAPGSTNGLADARTGFDPAVRQNRQIGELVRHTQRLLELSERVRNDDFWKQANGASAADWEDRAKPLKKQLWDEVIGRFPPASLPANPRARQVLETEKWTAYEVVLDVWPDVFAWGILLVPKDLKPGEQRPAVVCQHGLEGVPMDTVVEDPKAPGFGAYKGFAAKLAERGFVTFAPHNPYRGRDNFRVLQRKANPLGKSLFSVILGQHERLLDWLSEMPFIDPARIGFYGLSYGGKTAMRVPPLLDRYCLSICSADFNEWVKKNATVDSPYSYMFTIEYEMPEFNLGHTFNYAEMAALIAPRPFMVERGHHDGVAPDEWVAYEYAKVRRFYAGLGIPDRTRIEFFNGPHTINGVGTFEFLHEHLRWPAPVAAPTAP